jgi:polysaccharide pyruvyl transferase WcaK-like protein
MKSLFILNGSSGNRGCEAILMSTWDLLRQADPKATAINSSLRDPRTGTAAYLNQPGLLHRCHPDPGTAQFLAWQWAKRVRALMDGSGRPVLLVPHVFEPGNDDQAFMAQLLERIGAPADRLALLNGRDLSCMQLKQVISRLHIFVGARTHATIAAMSRGVPTLSIGYSVKARGINEEVFGSTDWMVSHEGLDAETLVARYKTLDENAALVREALAQRLTNYRMTAQDIRNVLARVII